MDPITFNINLQEGLVEGDFRRYEPGSAISGRVQIIPNEDISNARSAAVKLRWRTEGRGDLNSETLGEVEISKGALVKGRPIERDFHFQLPLQPWSYTGYYISIVWEIIVYVDVSLDVDPNHVQPFILHPLPQT
jgi:hypothetical protein